ncbi:MFS transporter, partial [Halobacteriales archaeon SW_7_68_16]
DADGTVDLRRYAALFDEPRFSTFVVVTALFSFAYNSVVAFLPLFLTAEVGLAPTTANLLYSALFVVSLVQLGTGEASDRVGVLPVLVGTLGVATAGLGALVVLAGGATATAPATGGVLGVTVDARTLAMGAAVVALGLGSHGYRPARGAYLMDVLPGDVSGGGLGAVRTLLMGAGAVGPAVVGYLSETAGFVAAFSVLVAALACATALTAALWALDRRSR